MHLQAVYRLKSMWEAMWLNVCTCNGLARTKGGPLIFMNQEDAGNNFKGLQSKGHAPHQQAIKRTWKTQHVVRNRPAKPTEA